MKYTFLILSVILSSPSYAGLNFNWHSFRDITPVKDDAFMCSLKILEKMEHVADVSWDGKYSVGGAAFWYEIDLQRGYHFYGRLHRYHPGHIYLDVIYGDKSFVTPPKEDVNKIKDFLDTMEKRILVECKP